MHASRDSFFLIEQCLMFYNVICECMQKTGIILGYSIRCRYIRALLRLNGGYIHIGSVYSAIRTPQKGSKVDTKMIQNEGNCKTYCITFIRSHARHEPNLKIGQNTVRIFLKTSQMCFQIHCNVIYANSQNNPSGILGEVYNLMNN